MSQEGKRGRHLIQEEREAEAFFRDVPGREERQAGPAPSVMTAKISWTSYM